MDFAFKFLECREGGYTAHMLAPQGSQWEEGGRLPALILKCCQLWDLLGNWNTVVHRDSATISHFVVLVSFQDPYIRTLHKPLRKNISSLYAKYCSVWRRESGLTFPPPRGGSVTNVSHENVKDLNFSPQNPVKARRSGWGVGVCVWGGKAETVKSLEAPRPASLAHVVVRTK